MMQFVKLTLENVICDDYIIEMLNIRGCFNVPIYEYCCKKCNDLFAVLRSMNAGGKGIKCPKCGSADVQKKISSFSCCAVGGGDTPSFGHSGGLGGG